MGYRDRRANRRRFAQTVTATFAGVVLAGCTGGIGWPSVRSDDSGTDAASDEPEQGSDETEVHEGYETTEVVVASDENAELGSVTAAIADTRELQYLGLSDTEYLPEDRGMLFVYDDVDDRTFVMREMDFGIDIVYADDDGQITTIHHAPAPGPDEDGESHRYPGRGQYILEVVYEWTADRGIEPGHTLEWGA
ncbi:DUF192 domain-containing protein [Halovivax gelatinilyticus]|uniref:DUF192 domain-containing protein n=1 Tax=Halovivax gelatinilyticus TaxID=2961597 RepID=UPI0020CA2F4B|nr:DUF192 domain-containing protein [Halovivax gelatinilyticus]